MPNKVNYHFVSVKLGLGLGESRRRRRTVRVGNGVTQLAATLILKVGL